MDMWTATRRLDYKRALIFPIHSNPDYPHHLEKANKTPITGDGVLHADYVIHLHCPRPPHGPIARAGTFHAWVSLLHWQRRLHLPISRASTFHAWVSLLLGQ